jgi:hypothetical protein
VLVVVAVVAAIRKIFCSHVNNHICIMFLFDKQWLQMEENNYEYLIYATAVQTKSCMAVPK